MLPRNDVKTAGKASSNRDFSTHVDSGVTNRHNIACSFARGAIAIGTVPAVPIPPLHAAREADPLHRSPVGTVLPMTLKLQITAPTNIPLEVDSILPEDLRERSLREIERLEIQFGNKRRPLAEFFSISGDPSDERHAWEGDLRGVHWLGTRMNRGEVHISGSIGRHLGSQMRGGRITVEGDASDWVGGEMSGGTIRVQGHAGHLVGAGYRGSPRGMTGGTILIHGHAGNEIGHAMRRGLVAVGGTAGDLVGFNMLAGTILVFGTSGIRHGAGMRRGTIGLFGSPAFQPLSSFRHACRCQLDVLRLLARTLEGLRFPPATALHDMTVDLFHGDLIEGGRGELLIASIA
jgi:formylmethanofuran dehydrogenase subunit C